MNITEYLDLAAEKFPDKIALSDKSRAFDYRTLLNRVNSVSAFLFEKIGTGKSVLVGISRSVESVVLFLGVAKSGNFFVPVDFSLPAGRITQMKETVSPSACLLANERAKVPFSDIPVYPGTEAMSFECDGFEAVGGGNDPLYCIFTAGSTGIPKGVLKSHKSVEIMTECFSREFGFDSERIFGNQCPFDFDVSYKDIFSTIRNGAELHILEKTLFSFPTMLTERLNERKINTLLWSVSAMKIASSLGAFSEGAPKYIKQVMFSGEVMPTGVLSDWRKNCPDAEFVNLYGPTEIAYNCTFYRVKGEYTGALPAGKAFDGTEVFLFDKGEITSPGITGEIYIKSPGLARGYYKYREKTAASFPNDPRTGEGRVYKTGDNGAWNENGELVFKGRKDWQIKHMGHRIELSEVETAASNLGYLGSLCCIFDKERDVICLFHEGAEDKKAEISKDLRRVLPSYMIPTDIRAVKEMPKTRTGKIDRNAVAREYLQAE